MNVIQASVTLNNSELNKLALHSSVLNKIHQATMNQYCEEKVTRG